MPASTSPIPSGRRIHRVLLQAPGLNVPDGDGGYTNTWTDLSPNTWQVAIEPATARDLERLTAGTVIAQASHIVTGPYRDDVTINTRVIFNGRTLNVIGVANPEEKNVETIALCSEVVS